MPFVQDLPAELLVEIFMHCAPRDRDALYSEQGVNWVAPSQVCRQWRSIALACKKFWAASIPFEPPYWTYMALRRARDAPLAFNIDLSQSDMRHCATTVALHTEQLVELAISGSRWEIRRMLAQFVQDSAPRLEVLSLKVESPYDHHSTAPCLPDVFQGHTLQRPPLLRTLELDFCYLPLTSNLYAGVTTFVLRYPSPLWSVGFIHDLLQTMPQLQSVCLASVYDMPLITPGQVLVLPRSLASMRFVASPRAPSLGEQCAFELFLQSLKFTAESWVVVCEVAELLHTVPVLHRFHDYVGPSPVELELGVERSYDDEGTVAETLDVRLQSGTGSQCQAIVLNVFSPSPSIAEALRRPLEMIRPFRVVDFSARGFLEDDNSECASYGKQPLWWKNNMPHVTNWTVDALPPAFLLEGVVVRLMLSIGVDTRFCDRRAVCDEDGHVIQLFPNLQSIRLVGIDLWTPLVGYYKARVAEKEASVLPLILMIVWACAERQRLKVPNSHVPRIFIKDCKGVDVGVVYAMRGLTSVEWDGMGQASWTDYEDVRTAVLEEYTEMFAAEEEETVRGFTMPDIDEDSAGSSS
ncbi:uncharacterized protein SCHCODRAFT_02693179 [Schizophyllum commune H4-8]|nr:uncharacterized protein SCHCODRAFT_02693179 [Schizophyllum commune H4-8]KAI5886389.1 hypothetical protein SCHCODRAFT_02693179 [Schizophyllum commune H4-8]